MIIAHEFDYRRPTTLAEALGVLADHPAGPGPGRRHRPGRLAARRCRHPRRRHRHQGHPRSGGLTLDDDTLRIGALVTFTELIESDVVDEHVPLLAEMAETVASVGIRNRATMVGNICSAVPSCDAGPVLLVFEATIHVAGPEGERTIPITEWFVGLRKTALAGDEVVTRVTIPLRTTVASTSSSCDTRAKTSPRPPWRSWPIPTRVPGSLRSRRPDPVPVDPDRGGPRGRALDDAVVGEAVAMVEAISPHHRHAGVRGVPDAHDRGDAGARPVGGGRRLAGTGPHTELD